MKLKYRIELTKTVNEIKVNIVTGNMCAIRVKITRKSIIILFYFSRNSSTLCKNRGGQVGGKREQKVTESHSGEAGTR